MLESFKKSLLLRLGTALATIVSLAFLGMSSSVFFAETSEGQAAAINQAGTLRMQSYRIANALANHGQSSTHAATVSELTEEFAQRLHSERLTGVLTRSTAQHVLDSYERVRVQWEHKVQPLLTRYLSIAESKERTAKENTMLVKLRSSYLREVDTFVADVDNMVMVLEVEAEENIQLLRLFQVISLLLTIVVVIITMYFMNTTVLVPLRELLASASAVRHRDFSRRTRFQGEDELGQLGYTFNLMAEDLSKIYNDLGNIDGKKTPVPLELLPRTGEVFPYRYKVG